MRKTPLGLGFTGIRSLYPTVAAVERMLRPMTVTPRSPCRDPFIIANGERLPMREDMPGVYGHPPRIGWRLVSPGVTVDVSEHGTVTRVDDLDAYLESL